MPGHSPGCPGTYDAWEVGRGSLVPPAGAPHRCHGSFCPLPPMSWGLGRRQPSSNSHLETPALAGSFPKPCLPSMQCARLQSSEVPQEVMGRGVKKADVHASRLCPEFVLVDDFSSVFCLPARLTPAFSALSLARRLTCVDSTIPPPSSASSRGSGEKRARGGKLGVLCPLLLGHLAHCLLLPKATAPAGVLSVRTPCLAPWRPSVPSPCVSTAACPCAVPQGLSTPMNAASMKTSSI